MLLTVILLSQNPRRAFLERALSSLQRQTLPARDWELLVVSRPATESTVQRCDLSWHPAARRIRAEQSEAAIARVHAFQAASADVVLFVDDDDSLDENYLAAGIEFAAQRNDLGMWGGQSLPDFEAAVVDPPLVELYFDSSALARCAGAPRPGFRCRAVDVRRVRASRGLAILPCRGASRCTARGVARTSHAARPGTGNRSSAVRFQRRPRCRTFRIAAADAPRAAVALRRAVTGVSRRERLVLPDGNRRTLPRSARTASVNTVDTLERVVALVAPAEASTAFLPGRSARSRGGAARAVPQPSEI